MGGGGGGRGGAGGGGGGGGGGGLEVGYGYFLGLRNLFAMHDDLVILHW